MSLGVDPRNDYAFRCVFGNEQHKNILIHLLNAVLRPPVHQQITAVEILNPFTLPVVLEDKQLILDIKAQDQTGRLFNVEMQMVPHAGLRDRLLYYWAKLYATQLIEGENYTLLRPVISICFLDSVLFKEVSAFHLLFQLVSLNTKLILTNHLQMHLFQLPRFTKKLEELTDPLDKWLYFLNNGKQMDSNNLPPQFHQPEYREAVKILKQLTQEDIERERFEAREKARRDLAAWQQYIEEAKAELQQAQAEAQQAQAEVQQAQAEAQQARKKIIQELIEQIHLCEAVLNRELTSSEQLQTLSEEKLRDVLTGLRQEVLGK